MILHSTKVCQLKIRSFLASLSVKIQTQKMRLRTLKKDGWANPTILSIFEKTSVTY